jgi:D-beta-D-heptose 7-phosphate kinase/D-beta-D-heptose 1-phosphate adenosyltransferase
MFQEFSDIVLAFLESDLDKTLDINVVGDVMIDEYYEVHVDRISPEFPIPVYHSTNLDPTSGLVPGGAANVAYQFQNFNVNVELVSLLNKMTSVVFDGYGIGCNHSKVVDNIFIPTKKRIYADNIPLTRWDFERPNYGLDNIKNHLLDLEIPESDFNIFSDYSKGLFSYPWFRKYISTTKNIVDPKHNFIDLWEGCTYFKPNAKEAEKLSERKNVEDQVEFFLDALKCKGVLITQSGSGVVGKQNNKNLFEVRPNNLTMPPESVIGAGDCFVSFATMALARGFSLEDASKLAFAAGCFYVQRKHNRPVSPIELLLMTGVKQLKKPELLKRRDFKLIFTNGCFDFGLTAAHIELLKFAKAQGDILVVGLNGDASVSRLKGSGRPIMSYSERAKVLSGLEFVDFVVEFEEDTPYELIKTIGPDVVVKGGDYKRDEVVGGDLAEVVLFKKMDVSSTTDKLKKMGL